MSLRHLTLEEIVLVGCAHDGDAGSITPAQRIILASLSSTRNGQPLENSNLTHVSYPSYSSMISHTESYLSYSQYGSTTAEEVAT